MGPMGGALRTWIFGKSRPAMWLQKSPVVQLWRKLVVAQLARSVASRRGSAAHVTKPCDPCWTDFGNLHSVKYILSVSVRKVNFLKYMQRVALDYSVDSAYYQVGGSQNLGKDHNLKKLTGVMLLYWDHGSWLKSMCTNQLFHIQVMYQRQQMVKPPGFAAAMGRIFLEALVSFTHFLPLFCSKCWTHVVACWMVKNTRFFRKFS